MRHSSKYFPQILEWFGEANTALTRAFIDRWPTLAAAKAARADATRKLIRAHSRKKADAIEAILSKIDQAVPLTTDLGINDGLSLMAQSLATMLEQIEQVVRRYDREIADTWSNHPDSEIFDSFPGSGAVMAPRLTVAFGTDRNRFDDASEIQRYSGIAPVIEASGKKRSTHARLRCPKFLRQTFHEFAEASLPFSEWALAFYRQQRARGAGHHAAIRALAFRWIRILFRCWKTRTRYDEQAYVASLRRRGSPLASKIAA